MTYTFTNGSTSDATQVNTDFTDIINALTDGSADLSIGTLTAAGAVTFNGNVALGNASADDITFTGSVESHIPFGTNATYDIGAATLGPRSIYLGNGTKSTRIIAGTVGTSWTFTLPNDVSATGQGLIFNSSGTAEFRYEDKFTASKTSDYTATGDETIIPCAPAASMTITLPAASTMTGKSLTIIKTDSDLAKTVTIDGNASETINGATTYVLYTQYESVTIKCDGSNWFVSHNYVKTSYSSGEPITFSTGTKGTTSIDYIKYKRSGMFADILVSYQQTSAGTAGSGDYIFSLPTNVAALTTLGGVYTGTFSSSFAEVDAQKAILSGNGHISNGTAKGRLAAVLYSSSQFRIMTEVAYSAYSTPMASGTYPLNNTTLAFTLHFRIPVSGWNA